VRRRMRYILVSPSMSALLFGLILVGSTPARAADDPPSAQDYAPPDVRPGESGWSLYENAPTWTADTVAGLRPGNATAEATIVHYLASRVRGDRAFAEVLPLATAGAERLRRKFADHDRWTFHAFRLVGRKEVGSCETWLRVWMQTSCSDGEATGEEQYSVCCSRGNCVVVSFPIAAGEE
jgi:hypothetical protein